MRHNTGCPLQMHRGKQGRHEHTYGVWEGSEPVVAHVQMAELSQLPHTWRQHLQPAVSQRQRLQLQETPQLFWQA